MPNRCQAVSRPGLAQAPGQGRVVQQRPHGVDQAVGVGVDHAVDPVVDDGRQLGRSQADHRHPDRHGLAQRQAEAGVADRVEVEAVVGHEVRQVGGGISPRPSRSLDPMPTRSRATRRRAAQEHVGPQPPAPSGQVVDHGEPPTPARPGSGRGRGPPRRARSPRWGGAVVPHEPVEGGHVDDQRSGIVDGWRVPVGDCRGGSCSTTT